MDFSKMTVEELRDYCVKSLEKENEFNQKIETLNSQITEKDKTIDSLNSNVSDLKQKNYDLFIKVSNPPPNIDTPKQQEVLTIDELINTMIGDGN